MVALVPHPVRNAYLIVTDVARAFGVARDELTSHSRLAEHVRARFAACKMIHAERGLSYCHIGRVLGGRDHTTIINALRRADELLATDPEFAYLYQEASRC